MMMRSPLSWLDPVRAGAATLRRAFDVRARRERLILIAAAVAGVWMLADNLWLTAAFKELSTAQTRLATAVAGVRQLTEQAARHSIEARNTEQRLRGEVAQARMRVSQGEAALRASGASLVGAADMVPMLDHLLARTSGLRLRSMQSLGRTEIGAAAGPSPSPSPSPGTGTGTANAATNPAARAAASPASAPHPAADAAPVVALYRHGVELTIEGSYAEVLAYVRGVETLPQRVLWGGLQLKVDQYPKVVATLRLYTLSQDRNWLEI